MCGAWCPLPEGAIDCLEPNIVGIIPCNVSDLQHLHTLNENHCNSSMKDWQTR